MLHLPDDPTVAVETALTSVVRMMVEHADPRAKFCGIQRAMPPEIPYSLVMFNAPCGSTCALKMDENLTTESIRRKIQAKEAEFGRH